MNFGDLEKRIKIYEEAIKDLEREGESIDTISLMKFRLNCLLMQYNLQNFLMKEKPPNFFFVK